MAGVPFLGSVFFLSVLGYALLWMLLLPRLSMGRALLTALCTMLFAAYWGVILLEWMVPTAYVLLLGGLVGLLVGVGVMVAKGRALRERVFSVSLWAYLGMSALFVLICSGFVVEAHDEFSFWARATRELYLFDESYFNVDANLFHTDYNPIFASLQYCIMRVFGWRDPSLCYVPIACIITSICAMADGVKSKPYACFFVLLALFIYPMFGFHYTDLTVDGPLWILFLAGLLTLVTREGESPSALMPVWAVIAILPAIKIYSGLMFALTLVLVMLIQGRKGVEEEGASPIVEADGLRRLPWRHVAIACGLLLLMQLSWSGYYHYQVQEKQYQETLAKHAYLGTEAPAELEAPRFTLGALVAGNPRTTSLGEALTPEQFEVVVRLTKETVKSYLHSALPLAFLFAGLMGFLWWQARGRERREIKVVLITLLATFACYFLGLVAGYFVQAEISGGAMRYLVTVSTPLVMGSVFFTVRSAGEAQSRFRLAKHGILALCMAYILLGTNATQALRPRAQQGEEQLTYASHARLFYGEEAGPLLSEEDIHARAVVMDCSWGASQISSTSGITHAYQYYGLPMRVDVYQFPYGDDSMVQYINMELLTRAATNFRADLLLLRVEDEQYKEAFAQALGVDGEADMPWVVDVTVVGHQPTFALRNQE